MTQAVVRGGVLRLGRERWRASVGRGGVRQHKQEGDGATPAGVLPLRRVLYRADRVSRPRCSVPVEAMARQDGWCDDPVDPRYNTRVRLPIEARHECLWRDDPLYDVIGILGWNDAPAEPGRGSAIFLHVAASDWRPTDGCVALAEADLRAALAMGLSAVVVEGA